MYELSIDELLDQWTIDTELLYNYYLSDLSNNNTYNLYTNNCSDEVKKALDHAWFFKYTEFKWFPTALPWNIWIPWTTPAWLMYDIKLEKFYKTLFD